jgi:aminopeptidase N
MQGKTRMFRAVNAFAITALLVTPICGGGVERLGDDECCVRQMEQPARRAPVVAPAWDEATGRDLRNYPPDRVVDYKHMKLQMRFEDLNDRSFTATETLTIEPIGEPTQALTLDAVDLKISKVVLGGKPVEYSSDGKVVAMRFDPPLPLGLSQDLVIEYACEQPYDGMTFTPWSPDAPHYDAQVHTQGETNTNRHWFACHDFPNERMTTELIVDVPADFLVSSNGRLMSNTTSGDRVVWHWLQDKPHVAYLVSLIIGKFDVVEIPHSRVPMKVWVPPGKGGDVLQTYGRTGEMIDMFEERFGVAYPWDRYDQLLAKNFHAGGMENTSATTMHPAAVYNKTALLDGDLDGLISHELCHQWTGDLITCKSWEHIWLNEGWATYGTAMWNEQRFGEDGYLDYIRGQFGVARRDRTTGEIPMVSPLWKNPDETFRRAGNPYPKGASIIHMLRTMLGDEVFWKGVQLYMNRHKFGVAETSDFRYALEEVSGKGLEGFFEQWCYRPGCPELNVKVQYDGATRELFVSVEQAQQIDARTPAFRFTLPVHAKTAKGWTVLDIDVAEKSTTYRATLDGPPSVVAVDPFLHVLKTMTCDKPLAMWMEQAKDGPTITAKHEAIEALGKNDSPDVIALLASIVRNDSLRHTVRNTAVDSLAELGSPQAKDTLLVIIKEKPLEARVRSELVAKLRDFDKDMAVPLLSDFAANDESYDARSQAINALAHHKATDQADLIVQLVEFQSQSDQVRNASLRALSELDDARGLDLAMKFAAYGYMDRSRPTAITTVGKLASHDKDKAVEYLLALLNDPESRCVSAAGSALAELGDERAVEPITKMSESARDPSLKERAAGWLKTLQEKKRGGGESAQSQPGEPGQGEGPPRRRRSE